MTTATIAVFDAPQLRASIVETFGAYGAHIQVFDDMAARIKDLERQASGVPVLAVQAIELLNKEVFQLIVDSSASMTTKDERRENAKEIKRKQAAVSVLAAQRGEMLRIGNQWRIKSESRDDWYITRWFAESFIGTCNCQAGQNALMCKHQEAARVLDLASEVK